MALRDGVELPQRASTAVWRPSVLAGLVLLRDGVELPQHASTAG